MPCHAHLELGKHGLGAGDGDLAAGLPLGVRELPLSITSA